MSEPNTEPSLQIFGNGARTSELTVKEFAARERVDEQTVRRWIWKGAVPFRRTPGGGIRILDRRERQHESATLISERGTR